MSYDLAYLGTPGLGDGQLAFNDTVCEGVYALAQRVLALLFTDVSAPESLGFGTQLPTEVTGANNYDPGQVKGVFDIAVTRVTDIIQQTTPPDAPLDSQLDRIEVLVPEQEMDADTAMVELTIHSRAGDSTVVKAPAKLKA